MKYLIALLFSTLALFAKDKVSLGVDHFFENHSLEGKRVGLVINHTSLDSHLQPTLDLFLKNDVNVIAIFCPEHGLYGAAYAGEAVNHESKEITIHSLHGKTRRPTDDMLANVDTLVFDMQEIGCRSYTYATTLFYVMEEAAKKGIKVIVLDRPNPMGGFMVDGPMLRENLRSFVGYINVPYCHGMTIGELARFFNEEYKIRCPLEVIPMRGWKRGMSYTDTGLQWIPTSPNIPEADTPYFYASTGILGELGVVSIGIGYTQPFKVVGAPWIDAHKLTKNLNDQKLPGVKFIPYHFRPFYGSYEGQECQGVKILITDPLAYRPLAVQYMLIGIIKTLYPTQVADYLKTLPESKQKMFAQVNGNTDMLKWIENEKFVAWKLVNYDEEERRLFLKKRIKYLIY